MQEKHLLKISLIVVVIGLFALFLFTKEANLESKIVYEDDDLVYLKGSVKSVRETNNSFSFMIERNDLIEVVLFEKPYYSIDVGDRLEMKGTVSGDSLFAEEIRRVS
jgi:hypothetical protein